MEVVPEKLITLSQTCLTASQHVAEAHTDAVASLRVEPGAAGNEPAGPALVTAHGSAAEAAELAIGRLVGVLESDMDALQLCAFDVSTTDDDQATAMQSNQLLLPGITVV